MENSIAKNFTLPSLIGFTLPTIMMLVFIATYTIVDGIFISRFVGTAALSAINIVFPLINILTGIGIMLGAGGSAIIGRRLGEGKAEEARRDFTLIALFAIGTGVLLSLLCTIFISPLSRFLGADAHLLPYCVDYGRINGLLLYFRGAGIVPNPFHYRRKAPLRALAQRPVRLSEYCV